MRAHAAYLARQRLEEIGDRRDRVGCRSVTSFTHLQTTFLMPVAPFQYGAYVKPGYHSDWSGLPVWGGALNNGGIVVEPTDDVLEEWAQHTADRPLDGHSPATSAVLKLDDDGNDIMFVECSWVRGHAYRQDACFNPISKDEQAYANHMESVSKFNVLRHRQLSSIWAFKVMHHSLVRLRKFSADGDLTGKLKYEKDLRIRLTAEKISADELPAIGSHQEDVIDDHRHAHAESIDVEDLMAPGAHLAVTTALYITHAFLFRSGGDNRSV